MSNSKNKRNLCSQVDQGAGLAGRLFLRLLAMPIGILVGVLVWILIYLAIFDSFELLPLASLAIKLSPGALAGSVLAWFYPQLFLWFLEVEFN